MNAVMWTKTDFPNGTCNLRTATTAKGATFEEILQNQAAGISVGSALPGQMEIDIDHGASLSSLSSANSHLPSDAMLRSFLTRGQRNIRIHASLICLPFVRHRAE